MGVAYIKRHSRLNEAFNIKKDEFFDKMRVSQEVRSAMLVAAKASKYSKFINECFNKYNEIVNKLIKNGLSTEEIKVEEDIVDNRKTYVVEIIPNFMDCTITPSMTDDEYNQKVAELRASIAGIMERNNILASCISIDVVETRYTKNSLGYQIEVTPPSFMDYVKNISSIFENGGDQKECDEAYETIKTSF